MSSHTKAYFVWSLYKCEEYIPMAVETQIQASCFVNDFKDAMGISFFVVINHLLQQKVILLL